MNSTRSWSLQAKKCDTASTSPIRAPALPLWEGGGERDKAGRTHVGEVEMMMSSSPVQRRTHPRRSSASRAMEMRPRLSDGKGRISPLAGGKWEGGVRVVLSDT
jgi:hypothetical protein